MQKTNGRTTNAFEFARVLEAATAYRDAEHKTWELAWSLGDAIKEELGPPGADGVRTGIKANLKRMQKFLSQHGIHYSVEHYRDFWQVASTFPAGERSPAVAWSVYRIAGTLEIFNGAQASARIKAKKLTVPFIKKYRQLLNQEKKREKKRAEQQQWEKLNPGIPRPDPARVIATKTLLDNAIQARELGITIKQTYKDYPLLTLQELDGLDQVLEVYYGLVQVHEEADDKQAVKDARSPAPQEDAEPEQGLHWTGDEDDGFLGCGLVDGGEMAFTVVPVSFKGCEHFEAKILTGSNVDLTLPVSELADRYGTSLTGNDKGGRRTLDPYPTSEEARKRCELAYASNWAE